MSNIEPLLLKIGLSYKTGGDMMAVSLTGWQDL